MNKIVNNKVITAPQNTDTISGFPLYLASLPVSERQAQGWYANIVVDANITEPMAIPEEDAIHIPVPADTTLDVPFDISKRALRKAMASIGKEAELSAYLASDPKKQEAWNDAICLASDDPLIIDALPTLQLLLPEGIDAMQFLRSCSIRL